MTTGAVMIGTLQAVIVAVMLAGSALILARYRHWKMLEYHPYYTTTVPTTSTAATVYVSAVRARARVRTYRPCPTTIHSRTIIR
jgi:hypothetical protein